MNLLITLVFVAFSTVAQAEDLGGLQDCLDRGYRSLANRHGIVAAAIDADDERVMVYGAAQLDQIFEIGSITKTVTATLLAQAIESHFVTLSDPIPATYQKPGVSITYQHLTTHTSGIIEGNFPTFHPANPLAPYNDLTIPLFKDLYAQTPLAKPPGTEWIYSNIGEGLLGQILAESAGKSYEELAIEKVLVPLGMTDSYFQVPNAELHRFPAGRMIDLSGTAQEMPHWDLYNSAIDPAGGLRSTIGDMIKYTRANLAPVNSPLGTAIKLSHEPLYYVRDRNIWMGMNWVVEPGKGLIWHNGETYGFNSILAVSMVRHQAVIAMTDTTVVIKGSDGKSAFDPGLQNVAFACLK